jgi:uncharacterized protein (TIGR02594 family)
MNNLSVGDRGANVSKLQLLLDQHLPASLQLKADGVFGVRTRTALIAFQHSRGLEADGVAGPLTFRALGLSSDAPAAPGPLLVCTNETSRCPWFEIAHLEFGVHRDPKIHKEKRIIEYLKTTSLSKDMTNTDTTAWCSAFVNWVMIKSGRPGTNDALAASWLEWKQGQELTEPRLGAVVVIRTKEAESDTYTGSTTGNHVGFCVEKSDQYIRLLGGNQGSAVNYTNFYLKSWSVRGYRWPVK